MPVLHVGAIFATQSKLLQRIYVPHANDSEIAQQFVGPGESVQQVPFLTYVTGGVNAVQNAVGVPVHSGRCAVIDPASKVVQHHIVADPALYTDPNGNTIVQSDISADGDVWNGTAFSRNFATVSTVTGLVVSVGPQVVGAQAVSPQGNILMVVPAGAKVGDVVFNAAKLAQLAAEGH